MAIAINEDIAGRLKGLRIVRGREDECKEYYRKLGQLPPKQVHLTSSLPEK